MLSIVMCAVGTSGLLGSRFDSFVKIAGKERRPIFLILTEGRNEIWRDMQRNILPKPDVKQMLDKVLILRMPSTDKTRPKVAKYCGLRSVRSPFFAFFDYDGKYITFFSGKVGGGQLKASIVSACAVAARRARRARAPRVWKKARTSPEAAKLRVAEMYLQNDAMKEARSALEVIAREYPGTPEAEKAELYLADLDAERKPVVDASAPAPSAHAAKELRMARMLIMNKAADSAMEKLREIVVNYPGSSEAEQAQELLSEMQ